MTVRIRRPVPVGIRPTAARSLVRWVGVGVLLAAVLSIALCLEAGILLGRYLMRPSAQLHPESTALRLDPSYTKGYLDGVKAGRRAAEMAPGRLTPNEMSQAVSGAEAAAVADEKAWGSSYKVAFQRGALAGLKQRLRERFGSVTQQSTPPRVIVQLPAPSPTVTATSDASPDRRASAQKPTPTPSHDEDQEPPTGGIQRVVHQDGTVEYSNH